MDGSVSHSRKKYRWYHLVIIPAIKVNSYWDLSKPYPHIETDEFLNPSHMTNAWCTSASTHTTTSTITPDTLPHCAYSRRVCTYQTTDGNLGEWQSNEKNQSSHLIAQFGCTT
jgi:hypothetical protein